MCFVTFSGSPAESWLHMPNTVMSLILLLANG